MVELSNIMKIIEMFLNDSSKDLNQGLVEKTTDRIFHILLGDTTGKLTKIVTSNTHCVYKILT